MATKKYLIILLLCQLEILIIQKLNLVVRIFRINQFQLLIEMDALMD